MSDKAKIWSEKKFVEVVAEIVDFFVNNHGGDVQIEGTKKWRPCWYTYLNDYPAKNCRAPMSPRQKGCWHYASEVSYIISCICAQHTTWGSAGVDNDIPFFELKMWETMSRKRREKLAAKLYRPNV